MFVLLLYSCEPFPFSQIGIPVSANIAVLSWTNSDHGIVTEGLLHLDEVVPEPSGGDHKDQGEQGGRYWHHGIVTEGLLHLDEVVPEPSGGDHKDQGEQG